MSESDADVGGLVRDRLKSAIPALIKIAESHCSHEYCLRSIKLPIAMVGMSLQDFARTATGYETKRRLSFDAAMANT